MYVISVFVETRLIIYSAIPYYSRISSLAARLYIACRRCTLLTLWLRLLVSESTIPPSPLFLHIRLLHAVNRGHRNLSDMSRWRWHENSCLRLHSCSLLLRNLNFFFSCAKENITIISKTWSYKVIIEKESFITFCEVRVLNLPIICFSYQVSSKYRQPGRLILESLLYK